MKVSKEMEAKLLKMAGVAPAKPARKPRVVALDSPARWAVVLYPACRVVTESNSDGHWREKAARVKLQRGAVRIAWLTSPLAGMGFDARWVRVTLTHIGPKMDGDNLQSAMKGVRDEVAACIGPDDGSDFYEWAYLQMTGTPGVEIRIEPR